MGSLEQAVYAIIISFVIGVILCPIVIPMLRKLKFGQNVRDDGPQTHLAKQGTPTMGGVAFLAAFVITSLFFLNGNRDGAAIMLMTLCYGFFTMYKFRTMCVNAEQKLEELRAQNEADGPVFKMKKDPRVTPIGRFLRKTSLDELPQFFNVLNGSMSLVGPRPPLPKEVEKYTPYQMHRLDAKGGITCYWQCSGRSNIMFDEWVELDLKYIRDRSFATDAKILFRTVGAVLRRDGAE